MIEGCSRVPWPVGARATGHALMCGDQAVSKGWQQPIRGVQAAKQPPLARHHKQGKGKAISVRRRQFLLPLSAVGLQPLFGPLRCRRCMKMISHMSSRLLRFLPLAGWEMVAFGYICRCDGMAWRCDEGAWDFFSLLFFPLFTGF